MRAFFATRSSMVLASQTVQVTSEAKASPIITAFTTISALRNMPHGDRFRGSNGICSLRERGFCRDREAGEKPREPRNHSAAKSATVLGASCSLCHMWFLSSMIDPAPGLALQSFCEMPTKNPRRGPNCGANTPMPEPSLIS